MKLFLAALVLVMPLFAAPYSVTRLRIDSLEVIELRDEGRQMRVRIAPSFGNNAYSFTVNDQEILWCPSTSLAELTGKAPLCGNPFLAPWANRIDGDVYWANGKQYTLNPALGNLRRDGNRNPIHGLLYASRLWEVVSVGADSHGAWVTSRLEFFRYPDLMAQFPFAHTLEITYLLGMGMLEVITQVRNHAAEPLPLAIGFHPYFRVPDAPRDDWKVRVAARQRLTLSDKLLPTGGRKPSGMDQPVPLRHAQLDDVFVDLVRDERQMADFWVEGARQKITVRYGPRYTVAVVYAPHGREFICFEPMTAITNGWNLAHAKLYEELQMVAPGAEWRESYWIIPENF